MNLEPLLTLIKRVEGRSDYDVIWGGIKKADYPPKPLTQMTVRQVLAWQDSIDTQYRSEAAGVYQFLEDTLRGLYKEAGVGLDDMFNKATQDKLALQLLRRRGLNSYVSGRMDVYTFANNLAKEWASLPVVTGPNAGNSHYKGDGLNKSLVSATEFLNTVLAIKRGVAPPVALPPKGSSGFVAWLRHVFFGGK